VPLNEVSIVCFFSLKVSF